MKTIFPWVGGKRFLVKEIAKFLPEKIETYYEPFLGSGAMLIHLAPRVAYVNDINKDLINAFQQIQYNADYMLSLLKTFKPEKHFYNQLRDAYNNGILTKVGRAAAFIYFMKLCYRGKYTVNKDGKFNQSFAATKEKNSLDFATRKSFADSVYDLRNYLANNNVNFSSEDFWGFLMTKDYKKYSFVYIDPPYVETNGKFIGYTPWRFTNKCQELLKLVCDYLSANGVKFLLSNSKSEVVESLYRDYNIRELKADRKLYNSKTVEYIITNY